MATVAGKTIQTAAISASASGNNTIVKGVAGKLIYVHSYKLHAAGTVTATWQDSSTSPTSHSGGIPMVANGNADAHVAPPAFVLQTTVAGKDLVLNLSTAVAVTGHISYWIE